MFSLLLLCYNHPDASKYFPADLVSYLTSAESEWAVCTWSYRQALLSCVSGESGTSQTKALKSWSQGQFKKIVFFPQQWVFKVGRSFSPSMWPTWYLFISFPSIDLKHNSEQICKQTYFPLRPSSSSLCASSLCLCLGLQGYNRAAVWSCTLWELLQACTSLYAEP